MLNLSRRHILRLTGAAAAVGCLQPAHAATFPITVGAGHAPVTPWVRLLRDYYIPEVDKRLAAIGHKVNWTQAFAGTLVKLGAEVESLERGIADLAIVIPVFSPAKLPGHQFTYFVPFATSDEKVAVESLYDVHQSVPQLRDSWARFNQHFLVNTGITAFQLFTKKPVRRIEDLKGMKIGAAGPNLNWLRGSGAVGVVVNPNTMYNDMQTGIYDGLLLSSAFAGPIKLHEVAPHMLKVDFSAIGMTGALVINKAVHDRLPAEARTVLKEVALQYRSRVTEDQARINSEGVEAMRKGGLQVTELDPESRARWAAALPDLAAEWAATADKAGYPGRRIINDYMQAMRSRGATLTRDWSLKAA